MGNLHWRPDNLKRPKGYSLAIEDMYDDDWDEEEEEMSREEKRRSKYFTQYAIEQGNRFRPTSKTRPNYQQVTMLGEVIIMEFI